MMIRDNGDIESKSDTSDCEGMPLLEDSDGDELSLLVKESLVYDEHFRFRLRKMKLTNK
jgi:hypothetical protein